MVQERKAQTLDELDLTAVEEVQQVVEEAERGRRDAKEGELLSEADLGGAKIKFRKQSSMVHSGGTPLPERVMVFDKRGNPSLVPTVQVGYHLSKRNKWTGEKKFFSKPPPGTKPPEPIDKACEVCIELEGKSRPFYHHRQWRRHMEILHPAEFREIQENEQRQREEEQRELILAAIRGRQQPPALPVENPNPKAEYRCRKCGKPHDTPQGRAMHERRWCKESE